MTRSTSYYGPMTMRTGYTREIEDSSSVTHTRCVFAGKRRLPVSRFRMGETPHQRAETVAWKGEKEEKVATSLNLHQDQLANRAKVLRQRAQAICF